MQVAVGESVQVRISLKRVGDEDEDDSVDEGEVGRVVCPRYPSEKVEGWWVVIGDANTNTLLSIKRVNVGKAPSQV